MRVVGKIIGYHGLKGEFKIYPLINDIELLSDFEVFKIGSKEFNKESSRLHKSILLLKLKGIISRTAAEGFSGEIMAAYDDESLDEKEHFIDDILGMKVINSDGETLGEVVNFDESLQSKLFIRADKSLGCKAEIILPFVEEFILKVDKDKNELTVKMSEDLIDLSR